jgi:hypothetical protein
LHSSSLLLLLLLPTCLFAPTMCLCTLGAHPTICAATAL